MSITKVSDKYQVVIPKSVRQKAKVSIGQYLQVYAVDNAILLAPQKELKWPNDYIGSEKQFWSRIDVAQYIKNERDSWD